MRRTIEDPVSFLRALGFHDAEIEQVRIDAAAQTVELTLDDIYANYRTTPEGKTPGTLCFERVFAVFVDIGGELDTEPVYVSACEAIPHGDGFELAIDLAGTGGDLTLGRRSIVIRARGLAVDSALGLRAGIGGVL